MDNTIGVNTADRNRAEQGPHGRLIALGSAQGEPHCSESLEPSSGTRTHSQPPLTDSDHEVSTSVTDGCIRPSQRTNDSVLLLSSSSSSDQTVTCSSGADNEEPLEKEEGEITDDEMDDGWKQCEANGSRISTEDQCSDAFQRDRRGSGRCSFSRLRQSEHDGFAGGHWQRVLPPATPVSSNQVARNVSSEDPECQNPRHSIGGHLIGSPITSDEEDAVINTQLLYFKEPEFAAEASDSELSSGERVKQTCARERLSSLKGRGVQTGSSMSSSDTEENQTNGATEVGAKRKVCDLSLPFWFKRQKLLCFVVWQFLESVF